MARPSPPSSGRPSAGLCEDDASHLVQAPSVGYFCLLAALCLNKQHYLDLPEEHSPLLCRQPLNLDIFFELDPRARLLIF